MSELLLRARASALKLTSQPHSFVLAAALVAALLALLALIFLLRGLLALSKADVADSTAAVAVRAGRLRKNAMTQRKIRPLH
jgi:hypothetical protein